MLNIESPFSKVNNPAHHVVHTLLYIQCMFTYFGVYTHVICLLCIQNRYHSDNPYHNQMHAADVLLSTDFLLRAKPIEVRHILHF